MKKKIQVTGLLIFDQEVDLTEDQIKILEKAESEYLIENDSEAGKILFDKIDLSKYTGYDFKYLGVDDPEKKE